MQILIAYAGKTGTTEKCAGILGEKLKNATIVNLNAESPDVSKYDLVIVGSSIRFGMLHGKVKQFIKKNKEKILTKKGAYYICCAFPSNYKEHFEKGMPKELLENAITYDTFGGEMDMTKQKGLDKFIVNMVKKTEEGKKEIKVKHENIDEFVRKITEKIK
ncbi:MAG: flavodoxin domain-containing protein [Oscillospiraceae bacterium]|nr:flavodoxin domain-containing protein [Oscillospiraceae bacterium]